LISDNGPLACCIVLALVLLFNVGLFYAFRSPGVRGQLQGIRDGLMKAKNSWRQEEQSLAELHEAADSIRSREGRPDA
jgi:hypothetical protein